MTGIQRGSILFPFLALGAAAYAGTHGPFANTFLANEGQWPKDILYKGRSASANVSLLRNAISFSLVEPEDEEHEEEHEDHHAEPDFIVWNMER